MVIREDSRDNKGDGDVPAHELIRRYPQGKYLMWGRAALGIKSRGKNANFYMEHFEEVALETVPSEAVLLLLICQRHSCHLASWDEETNRVCQTHE